MSNLSDIGRSTMRIRTRSVSSGSIETVGKTESVGSAVGKRRSLRRRHGESPKRSNAQASATSAAKSIDLDQPGPSGVQQRGDMDSEKRHRRQRSIHLQVPKQQMQWQQQQQEHQQQQQTAVPLLLINESYEDKEKFVIRPESKLFVSSLPPLRDVCSTLACLQRGLTAYEKIKTAGEEIDYLEAYCCKLPEQRRFIFFKKIIVLDPVRDDNGYCDQNGTLELIRLYVRCFATLGNFNFDYNLTLPFPSDNCLPNVLVVDKVWFYHADRRSYGPKYIVLKDDYYTTCVMRRLRDVYKCKSVRFVSTAHTGLFANSYVLHSVNKSEQNSAATDTSSTGTASAPVTVTTSAVTASNRPLKKRKVVLLQSCIKRYETQAATTKKMVSFADSHQTQQQPQESSDHLLQQPQPRQSLSTTPAVTIANPTLIIFRPNVINVELQLVCVICLEVHLSDKIKYN